MTEPARAFASGKRWLRPRIRSAASSARRRPLRYWPVLCLAALFVITGPTLAWLGARLLIVKSEVPSADAVVILSGSATYVERATWAARLYREGRAPLIVLTDDGLTAGWDSVAERNLRFVELAARELQRQGVPANKIRISSASAWGTYQESRGLCEYATAQAFKRLLVVTSAYHSRRALWSMRHACEGRGIEVGIDPPPPGWQTPSPATWWWHRWGWQVVAGEYAKMIYYWWRY